MGRTLVSRLIDLVPQVPHELWKHVPPADGKSFRGARKEEVVRIRNDRRRTIKAQVLHEGAPRLYRVFTEDRVELRRNPQHLLNSREQYLPDVITENDNEALSAQVAGMVALGNKERKASRHRRYGATCHQGNRDPRGAQVVEFGSSQPGTRKKVQASYPPSLQREL